MSLKRKIAISFFISAFIIAVLVVFEYVNFIEIRREIRYLEVTDTISRKSLQLRRHEKNYFLYSPQKAEEESAAVHDYLGQLKDLIVQNPDLEKGGAQALRESIGEYEERFGKIESSAENLVEAFERNKAKQGTAAKYLSLVEATFLEQPLQSAKFLKDVFRFPRQHHLIQGLEELDADISALRKTGESIMVISKDLDKIARENVETVIRVSQTAILIIFPLFFAAGIGMLFFISTNVVKRLMLVINVVEKTGKGSFSHVVMSKRNPGNDEVGILIRKFDQMEDELAERAAEIERKNKELMQTRKLAAIGTLAAGVAHELNNPLNNIHLSAQVLWKEAGQHSSPILEEAVSDILGQTVRVKRIVGDLLEYARGREPRMQSFDLMELIPGVYKKLAIDTGNVRFSLKSDQKQVMIAADLEQMEQVFINLFTNAVEAMQGNGELRTTLQASGDAVRIGVSDTGRGMPKESLDKVFEPFFTTKDKGTGLGLAIVFNIIRKHYGEITVASEEGKGTMFVITLPKLEEIV
jgi:two-component system NtrC family sensor kinase